VLTAGHHAFDVAGQDALEGLSCLPLEMLRCERLHAIERERELKIDRLLGPQRAVVVEHGDALVPRHEIRAPVSRYARHEGCEGLL
jgi:hypothetical protein